MDVLANILQWLEVKGSIYARTELQAPWGITVPESDSATYHVIDRGHCYLLMDGHEPLALTAGDLVMIPDGRSHSLVDALSTTPTPLDEIMDENGKMSCANYTKYQKSVCPHISHGGEGIPTIMFCGGFTFEEPKEHPLRALLPPLIYVSHEEREEVPWLETTIRFMAYEACKRQQGSDTMIAKLIDLLFIQIVRSWLSKQPEGQGGWLGALRDDSIRNCLSLIHDQPEHPWTVESLGKAVGMSRSGFSARFQTLVGISPLRYLTQWRMKLAARILKKQEKLGIQQLARKVGYDSEVSFSRAFKRHYQVTPGTWRRQQLTD